MFKKVVDDNLIWNTAYSLKSIPACYKYGIIRIGQEKSQPVLPQLIGVSFQIWLEIYIKLASVYIYAQGD